MGFSFRNFSIPQGFELSALSGICLLYTSCNADIRMSHQVLQSFGIHTRLRHIGTVGVSTDMRCDVRHLYSVNIIITLYHVIESMLPVHCYFWISVLVKKQKSRMPFYHFLISRFLPIFKDCPKTICHILCDRQFPCSCISFGSI